MADRKISDLTALTTPASGDYLPIVDISEASAANKNKRITIEELLRGAPDGTAGAPGIAFESDPNTGLYSPGADQVAISTNGTGRLFITSAGLVGIGTSSPLVSTHIYGATNADQYWDAGGTVRGYAQANTANANFTLGTTTNHPIRFITNATTALTIDASQRVGIGTTSPAAQLNVSQSTGSSIVKLNGLNGYDLLISNTQASGTLYDFSIGSSTGAFSFTTSAGERARIDSSGRLLVGTSTSRSDLVGLSPQIQLEGSSQAATSLSLTRNEATSAGPALLLAKSRGTAAGAVTVVQNNDILGGIYFMGADGTNVDIGAQIIGEVDGTPGANDMPGRLVFSTTADGASSPTERMRIQNTGKTTIFADSGQNVLGIHTASAAGTTDYAFYVGSSATSTTSFSATNLGIFTNGNVVNTNNSYGAISDIKLKENIVDANSQWDDLKALKIRNYNFKEGQTHTQIGLIAQEVELVSPGLVSESPDRDDDGNDLGTVTKSVNYSVLYMKAVKALQEAMERIETLEQRLNDAGIN